MEREAVGDGDPELIIFVDYGFGGPDANRAFQESIPSLSGMSAAMSAQFMTLTFHQRAPGPQNIDSLHRVGGYSAPCKRRSLVCGKRFHWDE